ncbi:MAG: GGDEF domain-containing protein [Anaerolineales bacterium]|nr:diguanylate cyclase [Anaerolineae bacterium]PWB54589.1 MAG: GGDEF domain-containing protein [Anaerolineales bacterium]
MIKPDTSQIDELTGLLSRKGFLDKFSEALGKAKSNTQERPLALALLDVDIFNKINETYGHVTGDNLLVEVAKTIQAHAGEQALVGRYGGDEFVIVFPGEEREQAFLKMERIRHELSQSTVMSSDGRTLQGISISAGVAAFPMDGRTENELLRKADHALYRAKSSGRRQVKLAYEERMVPKTTHYTQTQLERLSKLAEERGVNEADLLREAMDDFLTKYGVNDIES